MNDRPSVNVYFTVIPSFLAALLLQHIPWAKPFDLFQPSWLSLILIYWTLALPDKVSVGSGFALGIISDLMLGARLGIRALALSLLAYSVARNAWLLRNLALWLQAVNITLLTLAINTVIFLTEAIVTKASFHPRLFLGSLVNGLLWPWLFLLLRKIRRQNGVH